LNYRVGTKQVATNYTDNATLCDGRTASISI